MSGSVNFDILNINLPFDPEATFKSATAEGSMTDGQVLSIAKIAESGAVSWDSVKSYGIEVFERAQQHARVAVSTLTNG